MAETATVGVTPATPTGATELTPYNADNPAGTLDLAPGEVLREATGGDWRQLVTDEGLRKEAALGKYKTLDEAARGFLEAQKLVGDSIRPPKPDAKPEEWAAFHKKLGVPDTPDAYALELPSLPEGLAWQPDQLAGFRSVAHAAGITPKQAQALIGWYTEYTMKLHESGIGNDARQAQADRAAAVKALESRWGPYNGPMWQHYQGRAEQAIRTLMSDAPPEAVQRIVESANDPEVAHAYALLADSLLERGFIGVDEVPTGLAPDTAQQKADEIRAAALKDPTHPLNNPHHPDHERIVKQYLEYHAVAAGPDGRRVVAEAHR